MATLQKRKSRGHNYWSIVESRRVNGKPRPIILEYLGTADHLLKRLTEGIPKKVRSYCHGTVAVMLNIAEDLQIVETINKHVKDKQFRDGFTIGGSLLLAAIGRICHPTSKRNWYPGWGKNTSLSYLIRMSLNKLDSQHFWDQMDMLPVASIPLIEDEIINTLIKINKIQLDTLLYDTTNFFTYIASTNMRCPIAQRGKNKQKRIDLRQFGLMLLVTRQDSIPLFHKVYQGNLNDKTIFKYHFKDILARLKSISGSLEDMTLVFDQGNNSKKMLSDAVENMYIVGALSIHHHKVLIEQANLSMEKLLIKDTKMDCYRIRTKVWQMDFTVVVYVSEKLRQGQIRGEKQHLKKLFKQLTELKEKISQPTQKGPKRNQEKLEKKISSLIASAVPEQLVDWELQSTEKDSFQFDFGINETYFEFLKKQWFGRRILFTNRHKWSTAEIILVYWGQSNVEYAFKNMKNPFHLALRPQFHWTDQKVIIHAFICLISFLLCMVAYKRAKEKANFNGCPNTLIEKLNSIRLATFIEAPTEKRRGKYKAVYQLEEMDEDVYALAEAMELTGDKIRKSKIPFSVYK
jgi:transposase